MVIYKIPQEEQEDEAVSCIKKSNSCTLRQLYHSESYLKQNLREHH